MSRMIVPGEKGNEPMDEGTSSMEASVDGTASNLSCRQLAPPATPEAPGTIGGPPRSGKSTIDVSNDACHLPR